MLRGKILGLLLVASNAYLMAEESRFKFEGILGSPESNINNMNAQVQAFIPYNPIIVEVGAYEGEGTIKTAETYPYGTVFAFEPNPKAYPALIQRINKFKNAFAFNLAINTFDGTATLWGDTQQASLLALDKTTQTNVPCVVLDHWCEQNNIDHIDFLRLDAGGLEWKILQSSPKIFATVLTLVIKTHMLPSGRSLISFELLRKLLEKEGFELISHWYEEGDSGEATFVRKYLYDSIFR